MKKIKTEEKQIYEVYTEINIFTYISNKYAFMNKNDSTSIKKVLSKKYMIYS